MPQRSGDVPPELVVRERSWTDADVPMSCRERTSLLEKDEASSLRVLLAIAERIARTGQEISTLALNRRTRRRDGVRRVLLDHCVRDEDDVHRQLPEHV